MLIETSRLILRPFTLNDANEYYNLVQDMLIRKYVPFSYLDTLNETKITIEESYSKSDFIHDFYLLIIEKESGNIIGAILITQNPHAKYFDSCYFIGEKYRRKGYMKEALEAFLYNFPFTNKTLMFFINSTNTVSLNFIKSITGIKQVYPDVIVKQGRYKKFAYST